MPQSKFDPSLSAADTRHLLRRLAFAASPTWEKRLNGKRAGVALSQLIDAVKQAPQPDTPAPARGAWVNRALRLQNTTNEQLNALNAEVSKANVRNAELLRQWWLQEMIATPVPLRENLVLFFHSALGASSRAVDGPHALYGFTAVLRRHVLAKIPDLLEALVLDPAMMMQESYDETRKELPSDFSARRILDLWAVGPGNYTDEDADGLARALTGWVLEATPGEEPKGEIDPRGFRNNRRTGMTPAFHADWFDGQPKTILGKTANFGAREAVRWIALQPATARRYASLLIRYFGVEDSQHRLEGELAETYRSTEGSMEALLRTLILAPEFWSESTRWNLIKSPVHLAVGACRQLEIHDPPMPSLLSWLAAAGQKPLDAPNFGGEGWPGQQAWIEPAERLAVRYQLSSALFGEGTAWGLNPSAHQTTEASMPESLRTAKAAALLARLDPAPGLEAGKLGASRPLEIIRHVLATPEYQLA